MGERIKRSERNKLNSKKKKKKSNKGLKIFLFTLLGLFLFVAGFGGVYLYNTFSKVNKTEISQSNEDLGIDDSVIDQFKDKQDDIINIAMFGVDKRDSNENGRSDSTLVLTIDKTNKKIKISSIMRDSRVSIDGHGMDKLNHAYAYGGPQLAIKTLNKNFGLNIKDYVTVDFAELAKIIDQLGGVEINIKNYEVDMVNQYIADVAKETKLPGKSLKGSGMQNLSGVQAVAYSRVRYVGNGDIERTERQRTVLTAMFNKIKSAGIAKFPVYVNKLMPFVETNLDTAEILKLGADTLGSGLGNLEQERFPLDGYCEPATINGIWYWKVDLPATKDQIQKYVFEDIKPQPKK